jgi:hypothetical protein
MPRPCESDTLLKHSDTLLKQFDELIQELLSGQLRRSTFRSWEMRVLLDIEACDLPGSKFSSILKRYQKAARRHAAKDAAFPLLLSEYLESRRRQRKPPGAERAPAPRRNGSSGAE